MYVERDGTGKIVGVFTTLQPGIAEEELPDDDPAILLYREDKETRRINSRTSLDITIENINMRLNRIEKFLNFPIEGKLEGKGGKLQNCRVRGRGTVL